VAADRRRAMNVGGWCGETLRELGRRVAAAGNPSGGEGGGLRTRWRTGGGGEEDVWERRSCWVEDHLISPWASGHLIFMRYKR
jgi:hypothetical protein